MQCVEFESFVHKAIKNSTVKFCDGQVGRRGPGRLGAQREEWARLPRGGTLGRPCGAGVSVELGMMNKHLSELLWRRSIPGGGQRRPGLRGTNTCDGKMGWGVRGDGDSRRGLASPQLWGK